MPTETVAATQTPAAPPPPPEAPKPPADPVEAALAAVAAKAKPAEKAPEAPAEPPKQEAKPEEKVEEKPKAPTSAQLVALAKREERLVKAEAAAKAEREALAKAKADLEAKEKALALAEQDPVAFLGQKGWTQEKLAEYLAAGGKPTPDMLARMVREEGERTRRELAEERRKEAEAAKAEAEAAKAKAAEEKQAQYKAWVDGTLDFVNKNEADYPLTVLYGLQAQVPGLIEENFTRTGKVMSEAEAAGMVEKHLEGLAEKALKVSKVAAKLTARAPNPPQSGGPPQTAGAPQGAPKTLTNDLGASAASARANLPEDDLERALVTYQAHLKK